MALPFYITLMGMGLMSMEPSQVELSFVYYKKEQTVQGQDNFPLSKKHLKDKWVNLSEQLH